MKLCRNYSIDMAISKGYHRFKCRLEFFRRDVEMADMLCSYQEQKAPFSALFQKVDKELYPMLSGRKQSDAATIHLLTHLRATINVAFIKELYEEVTEYFRYILLQATLSGVEPEQIIGNSDIKMSAQELLSLPSDRDVKQAVVNKIFWKLEGEKSTLTILQKMNNRLGLGVDAQLMEAAIPYLKCRHIFVHSDGVPDAEFRKAYPNIKRGPNGRIKADLAFVRAAYNAVETLLLAYDAEMLSHGYFLDEEKQN